VADENVELVLEEARESMDKALKSLRHDLLSVRTGRASTALVDGIQVDYYGARTPLNQLANLSTPDPRLLVISAFDKATIQAIERAIQTSDLGLTPTNDGKVIRISIPPLTEERRKDMCKQVGKLAEDHKVGVRDSRRAALGMLKDLVKDGLPQDDGKRAEKSVQGLTDEFIGKIEEMASSKEREVLEV
jgi:ribosome recycling factor